VPGLAVSGQGEPPGLQRVNVENEGKVGGCLD